MCSSQDTDEKVLSILKHTTTLEPLDQFWSYLNLNSQSFFSKRKVVLFNSFTSCNKFPGKNKFAAKKFADRRQ